MSADINSITGQEEPRGNILFKEYSREKNISPVWIPECILVGRNKPSSLDRCINKIKYI